MARRFSGFTIARSVKKAGHLGWQGWLRTNYGNVYRIEVVHRPSYPEQEPWVWVLGPGISALSPHRYADGNLCLHVDEWIPFRSTAVSSISAAAEWLLLYDHWRRTGQTW